ncbi:hypothetical protein X801_00947 [Opisthorchis viverrini]|uniref:Uncharacterized protein n=1 Tax=Opisthorchis viverrini TaxID=6198 RepID=A0A1S8X8S7_OPIVI|nr:hypothetical protein X801_00947 [Opisthorchis viverrini]
MDTYGHIHKALQPQYLNILENKVRTLLYVGDVDGDCTFLEHLWFVEDLGLKMPEPLKQWLYFENDGTTQVGGVQKVLYHNDTPLWYVTLSKNLTLEEISWSKRLIKQMVCVHL